MKKWFAPSIVVAFLMVGISSSSSIAQIPNYYSNVDLTLTGIELRNALSVKLQSSTFIPYTSGQFDTWDALRITDQNPDNSNEVLLMYGWENGVDQEPGNDRTRGKFQNGDGIGLWNREHVFPRSRAVPALTVDNPGPGTDFHNLRPCDVQTNSLRDNLKFVSGNGNAAQTGSGWYPGDEWKGDVARIVMYMYLRYSGNGSSVAQTQCLPTSTGIGVSNALDPNMVNLFLEWNAQDPVSTVELQRNSLSQQYQNNRNPFIDNPALATIIWGGPEAEDTWGLIETEPEPFDFAPTTLPLSNGVLLMWTPLPGAVGCEIKGGPLGGNDPITKKIIGNEVGAFFVPNGTFSAGTSYQWKVRCATGVNPISGITPFSAYSNFTFAP